MVCVGHGQVACPMFRDHVRNTLKDLHPKSEDSQACEDIDMDEVGLAKSFFDRLVPDPVCFNEPKGIKECIDDWKAASGVFIVDLDLDQFTIFKILLFISVPGHGIVSMYIQRSHVAIRRN